MREILFRGKSKKSGEWIEGYYALNAYCVGTVEEEIYPTIKIFNSHIHQVYPSSVGQYTGLKDKNGQRIFEGDILGFINKYRNRNDTWKCTVEFVEGSFVCRYIEEDGDGLYNHFGSWNVPLVEWEIIGNIHDNPELLEDGR